MVSQLPKGTCSSVSERWGADRGIQESWPLSSHLLPWVRQGNGWFTSSLAQKQDHPGPTALPRRTIPFHHTQSGSSVPGNKCHEAQM